MKKWFILSIAAITSLTILAACSNGDSGDVNCEKGSTTGEYKVGMSTDSGTIDDKSFNQGTWEGIVSYCEEPGNIKTQYIKPQGEAKEDYLTAFDSLIEAEAGLIIAPGFKFNEAIYESANANPDNKFVLIDSEPIDENGNVAVPDNAMAVYFADQEAGFYAGLVAALSSKTGKVAFIGGIEVPAVQRYGWGYVAGVAYANENYDTDVEVSQYVYQGTFSDTAAGKTTANSFYEQGIDVIFSCAGAVGIGVINEGKDRRSAGEDVWVIGVDMDQYDDGIYDKDKNESVILTSAMKGVDKAAYEAIEHYINDEFQGGETTVFTSKEDALRLPDKNPNMSDDATAKYEEVYELVKSGDIIVPDTKENLLQFLTDLDYETPDNVKY